MIKKLYFIFITSLFYLFLNNSVYANFQEKLINKLKETKTLSFDFIQKINEDEEIGNCFIKYPLLMKCYYQGSKQKVLISNGKTVAIVKKKYKKIYYYPIKKTPLFIILKKEKIINLIRKTQPTEVNSSLIMFEFVEPIVQRELEATSEICKRQCIII